MTVEEKKEEEAPKEEAAKEESKPAEEESKPAEESKPTEEAKTTEEAKPEGMSQNIKYQKCSELWSGPNFSLNFLNILVFYWL